MELFTIHKLIRIKIRSFILLLIGLMALVACDAPNGEQQFSINFEKFTLNNGLEVIFHKDSSDPVTAVALTFHVGSAREIKGRTGFAHLFEHLLFLESENLGKGGLDKMSARIGGSGANGSTNRDRTNYFQTVPNDALEKMIWAEADKLGYFINTVTQDVLEKEKQVVKNEKRQSVDNRPYGHNYYVIDKNLYPETHPYNWQVIGSLEDLQNATLDDVKNFYKKWYVPNNATLVIAGDFDFDQAKKWVKKYFDEIPRGKEIAPMPKQKSGLNKIKNVYYEDNFARLPQLTMVWPTVEQYHADSYALDVLSEILSANKSTPFYKTLVEEKKLTSRVTTYNWGSELAGSFRLQVRGFNNVKLDEIKAAIDAAFVRFEKEGFTEKELNRVKAGQETNYYRSLSSVIGKAFQLAQYKIFTGDPAFINKDIQNILAVTKEDVIRVYKQYIKDKPYVVTSFVPKGEKELALTGSTAAHVVEEKLTQKSFEQVDPSKHANYERTPSSFDRSVEPDYGPAPKMHIPQVWEEKLTNGLTVYGMKNSELPLVQFNVSMPGGMLLDSKDKMGVAHIVGALMNAGTKNRTPQELEAAIDQLGASIRFYADEESFGFSVNTLTKNWDSVVDLAFEMLLEPRWDESEFALIKNRVLDDLNQQKADPTSIANNAYSKLIYGKDHILAQNPLGTEETVKNITLEEVKQYYHKNISPSISNLHVVGDITQEKVVSTLKKWENKWQEKSVTIPKLAQTTTPQSAQIYFYDVPNAKQTIINFGYASMLKTDANYYPAHIANYKLGGGGFASKLTQLLRETKGYTYGIYSTFAGSNLAGSFRIASRIRTNVTLEAAQDIIATLNNYGADFSEEDLATTKNFLLKSNARAMETLGAKLNMLNNMSQYSWPVNYLNKQEELVQNMTIEKIKDLSKAYLNPNKMIYLFVGDAKTQLKRLETLGYGKPILLN